MKKGLKIFFLTALALALSVCPAFGQAGVPARTGKVCFLFVINGGELVSAHLIAENESVQTAHVLSVSRNTRVVTGALSGLAPLWEVFQQENGLEKAAEAIERLLGGVKPDGIITVTPETVKDVVDRLGGITLSPGVFSFLPGGGGNASVYPAIGDMDPLALALKEKMNAMDSVSDYEMDSGKALYRLKPGEIQYNSVRVSGGFAATAAITQDVSDEKLLACQRAVFYSVLKSMEPDMFIDSPPKGYWAQNIGPDYFSGLKAYSAVKNEPGQWLQGSYVDYGGKTQLVPDTELIQSWVLRYVYGL